MEKIEIGEFIRTNKGNIGKVIEIFDGHCKAKYHIEFQGSVKVKRQYLSTATILKHSKNIIDLIEEGDIVNGMLMEKFDDDDETFLGYAIYDDGFMDCIECVVPLDSIKIKTILTHEQYEQNCYELEG